MNNAMPILSLLIALPLVGAVLIGVGFRSRWAKILALATAGVEFIVSLAAAHRFNPDDGGLQLLEKQAWIPSLHVEYLLGVDGIAVLFLPMTAGLTLMVMASSWRSAQHNVSLHYALLLVLEAASVGVFVAQDMVLFFLFWQLTLPPMFFLIGLWGIGPMRRSAASKAVLLMLFSCVPLLFAIIILAVNHATQLNAELSFSFPVLLETPLPDEQQSLVFVLLLLGFAAQAPLLPFHTWLPQMAMEGPIPVTALLIGLKLGVYGILRYAMPLAPMTAVEYNWLLGIVGAVTLVYGALIALQQTNLRRLLVFISISHVGLVIIGVASLTMQGVQGAILQLFNFTLIAAPLILVADGLQRRLGSTEWLHLGGLARTMPKLTTCYFILVLASIGIPGTSGFPAELLLVLGALQAHPSLGIGVLVGAVLSATCLLSFSHRAFLVGRQSTLGPVDDLGARELVWLCAPIALVVIFGFFPNSLLGINQKAVESWLTRLLDQPAVKGDELASRQSMEKS
jgi:NADH-quinone oxidoreductase subunit M